MKCRAGALVFLAVLFGATACGGAPNAPSTNGSYAWRPVPGGPSLVCSVRFDIAGQRIDYKGAPYYCTLPSPASDKSATIDFFGPSTVAAGPVPLRPHQVRLHMDVFTRYPAVLRVDFGDGTHWQRSVKPGEPAIDVVHTYAPTPDAYILATLRDKTGYLAVEGEGPLSVPLQTPRTRYCTTIAAGKGGTLSATATLSCADAERLYAHYREVSAGAQGAPSGYHCDASGLPPYGSDIGVETCTNGTRAFVFTSNP